MQSTLCPRRGLGIFHQALASALIVFSTQAVLVPTARAQEQVTGNTAAIIAATVQGLPSCLAYQVTGVCFFLKCYVFYCETETSIRVAHYMPDVVISTYNDPAQHPWADIGKPVAMALTQAGSSMMGSLLDSSASTARESKEVVTFKSADAIGNPVGAILGGTSSSFEFPDFQELMSFPSSELPKIMQQWATVPVDLGNNILEGARNQAMNPGQLLGSLGSMPGEFGGMLSSMGNLGLSNPFAGLTPSGGTDTGASGGSAGTGSSGQPTTGQSSSYQQMLDSIYKGLEQSGASSRENSNGNAGTSAYICPGGAGMLSIHYNSDIDANFWRGKIPLELLYPGSWIPGVGEVGNSLINTWGGTYPRTGELVQSHPVKSSAVLTARVSSIIRQAAQPHIYKKLSAKGESNYVYFKRGVEPRWQAVHPVPSPACITFGQNDSISLGSYGDYKTSGAEGYIWNLWNKYECCERKTPIFLFAVP
ncbi:TraU family protein [Variovorax sp. ZS18.2.2]|uniref:TraU family protein n=1 Tax=Variovorax sp. ZS18.2.2 TaxID=2971255 RepID=UPI0021518A43|nr:TraU family protein [Variovorax sp. ZS18.2.2]MCR6480995.1 TraU family protein [Variovorax sp. ZS18.2.2]